MGISRGLITDYREIIGPAAPPVGPIHPGEILAEEFVAPMGISAYALAKAIGVPRNRVTAILHGDQAINADTALRLGRYFGTSAEFWLGLQTAYDLETARHEIGEQLDQVAPHEACGAQPRKSLAGACRGPPD